MTRLSDAISLQHSSRVIAAALATAAFSYFGTGLHPIWWMLWLAPVPVLAIAPRLRGGAAFLLGSIAWLLGEMNQWNYVRHEMELPWQIVILYFVVPAVVFGFGVLIHAQLSPTRIALSGRARFSRLLGDLRISHRDRVASQHIGQSRLHTNELSAGDPDRFGHGSLGNQFRRVSVCRRCGSSVERRRKTVATSRARDHCRVRRLRGACFWRMAIAVSNPSAEPVAVTLIAKDVPMSVYLGSEEQALELLREYADEVRRVTPAGTQAVVLPEKIGRVSESALTEVDALFSSAATDTRCGDCSWLGSKNAVRRLQFFPPLFGRWKIRGELRQASSVTRRRA